MLAHEILKRWIWLSTATAFLAAPVHATDVATGTLTVAEARAVVTQSIDLISRNYVFPDARARHRRAAQWQPRARSLRRHERGRAGRTTEPRPRCRRRRQAPLDQVRPGAEPARWCTATIRSWRANTTRAKAGCTTKAMNRSASCAGNVRYIDLTGFRWNGASHHAYRRRCDALRVRRRCRDHRPARQRRRQRAGRAGAGQLFPAAGSPRC